MAQITRDLKERRDLTHDQRVRAAEFLRDTAHGRPAQAITGLDGGPLEISFTMILARIDGNRVESLVPVGGNGHSNGNHELLTNGNGANGQH